MCVCDSCAMTETTFHDTVCKVFLCTSLDRNPSPNFLLPSPPLPLSLTPSCFHFSLSSISPTFPFSSPSYFFLLPSSSPPSLFPLVYPFHSGFHLPLFLFFFPHACSPAPSSDFRSHTSASLLFLSQLSMATTECLLEKLILQCSHQVVVLDTRPMP